MYVGYTTCTKSKQLQQYSNYNKRNVVVRGFALGLLSRNVSPLASTLARDALHNINVNLTGAA